MSSRPTDEIIAAHLASGRRFTAAGVESFVLEQGSGTPVLLMPGTPAGSFAWRKVVPLVASGDLRVLAIDTPGIGEADRPADFDYSSDGQIAWIHAAVEALDIDKCHVVVHGISAPLALEWVGDNRDRVLSLTAVNSVFDITDGRSSGIMKQIATPGLGEFVLRGLGHRTFVPMFAGQAVVDRSAVTDEEIAAYLDLLKRQDGGKAVLKILRQADTSNERQAKITAGLVDRKFPARIVWGEQDTIAGTGQLSAAKDVLAVADPLLLPARHLPMEDQATAVAEAISEIAAPLA